MNLHEYQAKTLLRRAGVRVAAGQLATSLEEALHAAKSLEGWPLAVKAQIHAGGRGKGGGIKLAADEKALEAAVKAILGMNLITPQTGAKGKKVNKIYIERGADIKRELYCSLLVDRGSNRPAFLLSAAGGMDIEEIAATNPEQLLTMVIDPLLGVKSYHCRQAIDFLGLEGDAAGDMAQLLPALYRAFTSHDMSLLELNPLAVDGEGRLLCLDAKCVLDDNALFRHSDLVKLRDEAEEDAAELLAAAHDLSYIQLDGNVGCMVNGAGLAMATMDAIAAQGGQPANFLDVGGGADKDKVAQAFRILLDSGQVKAILVNIFGGIMRCDVIAQGIIQALAGKACPVPLVVRLAGTHEAEGRDLLAKAKLGIKTAGDLGEAAKLSVEAAGKAG